MDVFNYPRHAQTRPEGKATKVLAVNWAESMEKTKRKAYAREYIKCHSCNNLNYL